MFSFYLRVLKSAPKVRSTQNCGCRCRSWFKNIKLSTNTRNLLDLLHVVFLRVEVPQKMSFRTYIFPLVPHSTKTLTYIYLSCHNVSQSILGLFCNNMNRYISVFNSIPFHSTLKNHSILDTFCNINFFS